MNITSQSAEIIKQEDIYKHIELCGRVCYKSENKITNDSAERFVKMLIKRQHTAPLEHGTIYIKIPHYRVEPRLLINKYCFRGKITDDSQY